MGIGVSFFTEGVGAGPRKHMDILGLAMNDGADLRVHPSGKAIVSISAQTQGQGHETTFAQIVAEELGIPPEDVEVRHGDTDSTPYGLGTYGVAIDAGERRRGRGRLAQGARQGPPDRGDDARDPGRGPRLGEGPLVRQGRPREGRDDRGHRPVRLQRRGDARGHGGRARRPGDLRPAEPDLPVRRLHRGRRHRPRHRRGHGAAVHRGRRLRRADQPDDRRGPDPRRPRRGDRDRADGGDHLRRRGQLPERVVHGLPDPDRARVSRTSSSARRSRRARTIRSAPRASASRRTSARRRRSSTRSSTRCTRPMASTTSTCRARRPACGRRCRDAPSHRNDRRPPHPPGRRSSPNRARCSSPPPWCGSSTRRAPSRATSRSSTRTGRIEGFVGGVCAQNSVRLYSLKAIERGEPLLLRILPDGPGGSRKARTSVRRSRHDDGSVTVQNPCLSGGAIEVFLEPFLPAPRMIVAGDTPIAAALAAARPGARARGRRPRAARRRAAGAVRRRPRAGRRRARARRARDPAGGVSRPGVPYVGLVASRKRGAAVLDAAARRRRRAKSCSSGSTRPPGSTSARAPPAEIALSILASDHRGRAGRRAVAVRPDDRDRRSPRSTRSAA